MPSLNPYLSFKDQARTAMEFYQGVFGGDLTVSTFGDFPGMTQDPAENDLVMHSQLTTPDGFVLMGSDTPTGMTYSAPAGISVSVSGDDEAQLQQYWDAWPPPAPSRCRSRPRPGAAGSEWSPTSSASIG